jgi:hypothetical protein
LSESWWCVWSSELPVVSETSGVLINESHGLAKHATGCIRYITNNIRDTIFI